MGGDEGRCDSRGSSSTGALTGPPRSPQTLWPWAELPLSPPSVAAELEDPGGSAPIPAPGAPGAGTLPRTGTSTLREPWAVALLLSRLVPPSQSTAPGTVRGCHGPVAPGRAAMRGQFPARRRGWAEPGWGSHVWPLDALAGGIVAPGTRLRAQGDMLAPSGDSPTPSCSPPFQVTAPHPPRVTFPASSTRPAFPSPAQRHLLQPPGQPGDISCAAPPPQVTSPAPPPVGDMSPAGPDPRGSGLGWAVPAGPRYSQPVLSASSRISAGTECAEPIPGRAGSAAAGAAPEPPPLLRAGTAGRRRRRRGPGSLRAPAQSQRRALGVAPPGAGTAPRAAGGTGSPRLCPPLAALEHPPCIPVRERGRGLPMDTLQQLPAESRGCSSTDAARAVPAPWGETKGRHRGDPGPPKRRRQLWQSSGYCHHLPPWQTGTGRDTSLSHGHREEQSPCRSEGRGLGAAQTAQHTVAVGSKSVLFICLKPNTNRKGMK